MMSWFGRNAVIGLGIGVTVSTGVIALLIIKETLKRRNRRLLLHGASSGLLDDAVDTAALSAAVRGLTPDQHVELRKTLDDVMKSVSSLRSEIAELREGLRDITTTIAEDVKRTVEESQRSRRRRLLLPRERSESMSSSSIYFTASAGDTSVCDDSEAGYSTAYSNAESDYTDRETDRETDKDDKDDEDERDSDEEESCATVLTLRQEDSQAEEEDDEDVGLMVDSLMEVPSPELILLLAQSDLLHAGDSGKKTEGFQLLTENRPLYGDNVEFVWRLARAYSDMCQITDSRDEKRNYAEQGHYEAEAALKKNGLSAECHKWFAVLAQLSSQHESIHGKVKSSCVMKEHLDRALTLCDDDPICFYLLGRWCLQISSLSWLEKKASDTLYKTPPTSSVNEALENFLKAEELNPGFSKTVRLYIAKCHKELGNLSEARNWVQLALNTLTGTDEVTENAALQEELKALIDSTADLSTNSVIH